MRYCILALSAILILLMIKHIRGTNWIDYDEPLSNMDTAFDDDSDQYLSALTRDEEQEIYSPFITGYKYVSGMFSFEKIIRNLCLIYILF